jgi:predicted CoA-binding protein
MTQSEPTSDLVDLLNRPGTSVAVVGATDNRHKYGARIYRDLKRKGFRVFAVNPRRDTVDGDPCWPSLSDLPEPPTIVDLVVPPEQSLRVMEEALGLGFTTVWIQPGAEDDAVLEFTRGNGFDVLADDCIMVRARTVA